MTGRVKPVFIPIWIAEKIILAIVAVFVLVLGKRQPTRRQVRQSKFTGEHEVLSFGHQGNRKQRFVFQTTYHDYEAHGNHPKQYPVKVKIYAYSRRQATATVNRWIRVQNSEYSGYDPIRR